MTGMELLGVKLIVTPLLILACSLASRRWGDAMGGWLVGLPLTSGPVAVFLALEQGPNFVELSSAGSIAGSIAQACFCLAFASLASCGWPVAVAAGTVVFASAGLILQWARLSSLELFGLSIVALGVTLYAIPKSSTEASEVLHPWWDIPARMVIVAILVVGITSLARILGPGLTGVVACFPVFGIVLAVFSQTLRGPSGGTEVLRGMAMGLFGFAVFFYVLSLSIVDAGIPLAFVAATVSALCVQTASLKFIQLSAGRRQSAAGVR